MVIDNTISQNISPQKIWDILEQIPDPEIPVLSIVDLGIVRKVNIDSNDITIEITPTYSGCPAMDMIAAEIRLTLLMNNIRHFNLKTTLFPAWTTDWMTEEGKRKLSLYGIAPPNATGNTIDSPKECPRCHSTNTNLLSQFGSTPCKALYQCDDCREPFDYFKCH